MNNKHSLNVFVFISVSIHVFFLSDFVLPRWLTGRIQNNRRVAQQIKKGRLKTYKADFLTVMFAEDAEENGKARNPKALKKNVRLALSKVTAPDAQNGVMKKNMVADKKEEGEIGSVLSFAKENFGAVNGKTDDAPHSDDSSKKDGVSGQNENENTEKISFVSPATDVPPEKTENEMPYIASYLSAVRAKISREKTYPSELSQSGAHGEVHLKVTLNAGGSVVSVVVEKGSGYAALDVHAKSLVYSLSPFQSFPEQIKRQVLVLRIPLRFMIK